MALDKIEPAPRRAVALISGGLDSMLAARVMQEQGIHVEGINFFTGFCVEGHTHAIRHDKQQKPRRHNALWVAEQLGMKLHMVDVVEEYKSVLLNPAHGYGRHVNPCLDCKIFMVRKAREWMESQGFDFIVSGEVMGQRPNSQLKYKLPMVANQSGAGDRLLRPLCARNLPPTLPEREGWVDRSKLYDFSGRSRKPQMALAARLGIHEYAQPAGGCCFLTDESYSAKLVDLWQARHSREYTLDDIMLLKVGRHLRPNPDFKLIIGREEGENLFLEGYRKQFIHLRVEKGPLALIDGQPTAEGLELAARIIARFSQQREQAQAIVTAHFPHGTSQTLSVAPLPATEIPALWYV